MMRVFFPDRKGPGFFLRDIFLDKIIFANI